MKKSRSLWTASAITMVIAVLYTLLLRVVDYAAVGPNGSKVGFSHLNEAVKNLLGYHKVYYSVAEVLGFLTILLAVCFATLGLYELVRKRSVLKVEPSLLAMGILFAVVVVLYVFFEVVVINYRPVIIDGELEASFPSSHTLLSCVVCGAAMIESKHLFSKKAPTVDKALQIVSIILLVGVVAFRTASGVHWITDILGGILYSVALLLAFKGAVLKIKE